MRSRLCNSMKLPGNERLVEYLLTYVLFLRIFLML